jgi:sarcosine oxidase/L-pipecolate oxidase
MPSTDDSIIIVGAGVFGLSTALELRLRGYHKITVIDRMLPPVPDGSSVDISRVIRSDYTDPFYAKLASEAMDAWISDDWEQFYYNSGFVISSVAPNEPFVEKCKNVLREQNRPYTTFKSSAELIGKYPSLKGGLTNGASGYINHFGGWADAAEAIRRLAARCSELGISFITGPSGTVQSLITNESCVVGVRTMTGPIYGSRIILATGAWTNRLTDLTFAMSSSGQPVGFIQLTPQEAKSISNMPVVIDFTTGCFIFPPTPNDHVLKIARHSHGFEAEVPAQNERVVSAPKYLHGTISSFNPKMQTQASETAFSIFCLNLRSILG